MSARRWVKGEFVMHRRTHEPGRVIATGTDGDDPMVEVYSEVQAPPVFVARSSELKDDPNRYGFQYGPAEVIRAARGPKGHAVVQITTDAGLMLWVQVSPTGRSVVVHEMGRDGITRRLLAGKAR